jgi:hypothetical protein
MRWFGAARAARRHPELLPALHRGDLHLTGVSLLAAQLTGESCGEWIRAARHKTAEEIKRLLADRQPKPDVADCVRRVPAPESSGKAAAATASERVETPAVKADEAGGEPEWVSDRAGSASIGAAHRGALRSRTSPLGGERYRVCFTADAELHAQLQELRALMRHQVPGWGSREHPGTGGRAAARPGAQAKVRGGLSAQDPGGGGEPSPETSVLGATGSAVRSPGTARVSDRVDDTGSSTHSKAGSAESRIRALDWI